jgi:tungstate transport system substrate-binding protein
MIRRRTFIISVGSTMLAPMAHAVQKKSLSDPLRVGAEQALVDGTLATRLQLAFIRDTGVVITLTPNASMAVLTALERGEIDVSLTNAPAPELQLEKQGLAHMRAAVAQGDWVLVGPVTGTGQRMADPAGVLGNPKMTEALQKIRQAQGRFVSAPQGSGAHFAELDSWRNAKAAPSAPWYSETPSTGDALALAQTARGYTLVERGRWLNHPPSGLAVCVQGDASLALPVHVMQSFRSHHPAAKLFMQWITGPRGQRIANSSPGWHGVKR